MIRKLAFVFALLMFLIVPVVVAQVPIDMFGFSAALDNQGVTSDALSDAEAADQSAVAMQTLTAQDLINAENAASAATVRIMTLREQVDAWWVGLSNERVSEILSLIAVAEQPIEEAPVVPETPVEPPSDEGTTDAEDDESGASS